MSDEVQEKLEGVRRALLKNSIFFGIGWFVLMVSMIGLSSRVGMSSAFYGLVRFLPFLGWIIIGLPKIWIIIKGGGLGGALKADYEVVTTYGDGRKESDGGSQSFFTNLFGKLIQIGLVFVIGTFIQAIHLIILSIKYMVLHIKAQPKPAFIKSGMFIIVLNIAVFIGSPVLGAVIQVAGDKIEKAAYRAETGAKIIGDFDTRLNEAKNGRIILEYVGKGGDVVIPATFDGLPVVGIGGSHPYAFSEEYFGRNDFKRKNRITSVVIPETVTDIGGNSFYGCTELKQITLPKNLKSIGGGTFRGSGITSITIPEGVTDITWDAFRDCKNLTSVTFPRSLQRVGQSAFQDCTSLVNVTIPLGQTIQYGQYYGTTFGNDIPVGGFSTAKYFEAKQLTGSFFGCTSLSAASRQAIEDSGYIGEF